MEAKTIAAAAAIAPPSRPAPSRGRMDPRRGLVSAADCSGWVSAAS